MGVRQITPRSPPVSCDRRRTTPRLWTIVVLATHNRIPTVSGDAYESNDTHVDKRNHLVPGYEEEAHTEQPARHPCGSTC